MKMVMLCAGYGKRLRPLTNSTPKPLIPVAGRPLITWTIEHFKKWVDEFVIVTGWLGHKFPETLGDGSRFGVKITYAEVEKIEATGTSLLAAEKYVSEDDVFLAMNGDVLTNIDPTRLVKALEGYYGAIALVRPNLPWGVVLLDPLTDRVVEFEEKPKCPFWINAGVYAFKQAVWYFTFKGLDIEKHTFPTLARMQKLRGVKYENVFWLAIDTIKDLEKAEKLLSEKGDKIFS